jgi:hypothetical protein
MARDENGQFLGGQAILSRHPKLRAQLKCRFDYYETVMSKVFLSV